MKKIFTYLIILCLFLIPFQTNADYFFRGPGPSFTGSNTFSGTNAFSGKNTFTGSNTFSASSNWFSGSNNFGSSSNYFGGSNTFSGTNYLTGIVSSNGSINLTGNIRHYISTSSYIATGSNTFLIGDLNGQIYRFGSVMSVNLPQGAIGANAIYRVVGTGAVSLKPGTNDHFQYGGSVVTLGSSLTIPGAVGNYLRIHYGALSIWEIYESGAAGVITIQ